MIISDRFRDIVRDVEGYRVGLESRLPVEHQACREIAKACQGLGEWVEQVGDIPRMHLEMKLTPVLLKAHNQIDRCRLLFEEEGAEDSAAAAWTLQQKIYRLLNDL